GESRSRGDEATREASAASSTAAPRSRRRAWWALGALPVAAGLWLLGRLSAPLPPAPKLMPLSYSGADWAPAVAPDGRTLAFVSRRDGRPRIWLRELASGEEVALTSGPDDAPRFSPEGSALLFAHHEAGGSALYRVPVLGG